MPPPSAAPPPAQPPGAAAAFCARAFDFLVVGGGTAGLAVAARLSEDARLTVGVLEAGAARVSDDAIDVPGLLGQVLGDPQYDWRFSTTPQPGLGGRAVAQPRGRVLGGSSALNFLMWNRAATEDYDAWRDLGNDGWGWHEMLPFFKKTERFVAPCGDVKKAVGAEHDLKAMGDEGPVRISYGTDFWLSHALWNETINSVGLPTNKAHLSGSNVGVWPSLFSIDPGLVKRSYAANSYGLPHASRPNLVVLTEALVEEIILDHTADEPSAKGVRFSQGGQAFVAQATREVILTAGTVQSPQLLELSGIGNPDILARAGIETKVANPKVGENLQDHFMTSMVFEVDPTVATPDDLGASATLTAAAQTEFKARRTGPLAKYPFSFCYAPLSHIMPAADLASLGDLAGPRSTWHAATSQADAICHRRLAETQQLGQVEFIFGLGVKNAFFAPHAQQGKKYATMFTVLQYPFARGSVHIASSSATDAPAIDPQYYAGERGHLDLEVMARAQRFTEKICQTRPLADMVRARVFPPVEDVSSRDELDMWREWVAADTVPCYHPIGTCAMGGHAGIQGGVVDARLRVYGVKGLRVVDASVMPLMISAHLQATVYALAEKGASMILEDHGMVQRGFVHSDSSTSSS